MNRTNLLTHLRELEECLLVAFEAMNKTDKQSFDHLVEVPSSGRHEVS